ncbi:ABC transporter substrate-binding protein [Paenibacillus spongiae]|uniref:ABC transporter substrate-binding protein n=1 Tax=Paenibacillus spongiae TaxID=2909671 RepID=A0ABY5S980_9BACL|nr:ABC transporter substrate-binding protein [Paenibacillus spongiae]UVI28858.1 ABC transporter substrate-binding protein [Paenibacillus spongiae]
MNGPEQDWEGRLAGKPPLTNGFTSKLERKVRERIRMRSNERNARKSPFRAVAAVLSITLLLGGGWWFRDDLKQLAGQGASNDALASIFDDPLAGQEAVLKVGLVEYGDFDNIKKPFIIRHPFVQIETVFASGEILQDPDKYSEWFAKENADLLMLPMHKYRELAADGKLKALDTLIKQSNFDVEAIHKPLIDLLRNAGGGELYGLPVEFQSSALFVNKTLFAKHNIPLPDESATMDDILKLASRFAGTDAAGLTTYERGNPYEIARIAGQSSGLKTLAFEKERVTAMVQTDGWKRVWEQVAEGIEAGWIQYPEKMDMTKGSVSMSEIMKNDLFAQGKAAMSLAGSNYYGFLIDEEARGKKKPGFEWMTSSYRIDSAATNQGEYMEPMFVYAMSSSTNNEDAAWELLQFTAGPEIASRFDQSSRYGGKLLGRMSAMKSQPKEKWAGFYSMQPDPSNAAAELALQADARYGEAASLLGRASSKQFLDVVNGTKTVDQALAELQTELNASLGKLGKRGEQP